MKLSSGDYPVRILLSQAYLSSASIGELSWEVTILDLIWFYRFFPDSLVYFFFTVSRFYPLISLCLIHSQGRNQSGLFPYFLTQGPDLNFSPISPP